MYAYIVRRIEGTAAYRRMSDVPFAPIFGASPCATVRPWGTRGHLYRGDLDNNEKAPAGRPGLSWSDTRSGVGRTHPVHG